MSGPSPFNAANLDAALALAAAGIFIFPAKVTLKEDRWAKAPCLKNWQAEASTDPQQIQAWWKQHPHAVPGIELGRSGLLVLDADRHGNGPDGSQRSSSLLRATAVKAACLKARAH
jgi:Bifunctional DNA primase/polymerase, N-terminal